VSVKLQFDVVGLKELEVSLKELRAEMHGKEGNLVRNALNAVGRDVMARMKKNAPVSAKGSHIDWHMSKNGKWVHGGLNGERANPGRLRDSIFKKVERNPRYLSEVVYVGPRMGKTRNDPNGAWYAAIVEYYGGKNGKGKGFMRNSIDHERDANVFGKFLGQNIERVAKKIGNKNAQAVGAKAKKHFSEAISSGDGLA